MKVDVAREKTYGINALTYARKSGRGGKDQPSLPTIRPGQPEWNAWRIYFTNHMGFEPVAMQRVKSGLQLEMTVPAELPEQFDASYAAAIALKRKLDEKV